MTSLRLSQVRFKVAGWLASAFQKLLIQSVSRVFLMSSNTARTSAPAALSSISGTVGISLPLDVLALDVSALDVLAPELRAEPAGQEQPEHPEIAGKRPERMGEGGRPVALEHEMTEPGRRVADRDSGREPAPIDRRRGQRQQRDRRQRAGVMQRAAARVGMRGEIYRP